MTAGGSPIYAARWLAGSNVDTLTRLTLGGLCGFAVTFALLTGLAACGGSDDHDDSAGRSAATPAPVCSEPSKACV